MVITSSILFYVMEKNCKVKMKKSPSDKLQIKNVRVYDGGRTEVGTLYLVDCQKHTHPISPRKPVTFIFINTEDANDNFYPQNSDYAIITDIKTEIELFERVNDSMNNLQNWDCKLKDGLNHRYPLNEYVPIANEIIDEALFILNRNLSLLNFDDVKKNPQIKYPDNVVPEKLVYGGALDLDYANELLTDEDYHGTCENVDVYSYSDSYGHEYLCMNIFSENRYIARLMTPIKKYGEETDEGQLQLFRHFFRYIKQIYLRYSNDPLIKSDSDKLHTLFWNLIFEPEDIDAINTNLVLENYGWNSADTYSIIKFTFFKNGKWDEITEYICGKLEETWSNSCAIKNDDEIIWIVNHSISKNVTNERKFFHVLAYIVRDFVCKAGVSDNFTGLSKISSYLLQAEKALEIGQKCDHDKWYFKFSDYALDYMFDRIMSEFSIDQLVFVGIRKLIEYDKKNDTDFLDTLRCFLYNNCNSTHTADELFIHRTTLIRRMDRIEEISKIDFNDRDTHVYLIISFWILERLGYKFSSNGAHQSEESSKDLLQ